MSQVDRKGKRDREALQNGDDISERGNWHKVRTKRRKNRRH